MLGLDVPTNPLQASPKKTPKTFNAIVSRNLNHLLTTSSQPQPKPPNPSSSSTRSPKLRTRTTTHHKPKTRIIQQPSSTERTLFLELLFEQKRLLHRRKYFKVYENVFSWIQREERAFFIGLEVKLLRYFLSANLKILRNALVKKVTNYPKTLNLILQTISVYRNYYKFLTTALYNYCQEFDCNNVLLADLNNYPSLNSSISEGEHENLPPFLDLMAGKYGSFELFQNKVNGRAESAFFIIKTLEFLLLIGTYYRRTKELALSYLYLKKAHKTAYKLETNVNADLLCICAKAHLAFAAFLLVFGKRSKAKKILLKNLVILEAELCYRMSFKGSNELKKHEKLRIKRTVKTIISVVLNLIYIYETEKDIMKINESLGLLEYLCITFLIQSNDEFRKLLVKVINQQKKKYYKFFAETSEMNEVIICSLKNDQEFLDKLKPVYFQQEEEPKISSVSVPKVKKLLGKIKILSPEKASLGKDSPKTNKNNNEPALRRESGLIEKPQERKSQQFSSQIMASARRTRFSLDLRYMKENNQSCGETTRRTASTFKKDRNEKALGKDSDSLKNLDDQFNLRLRSSFTFKSNRENNSFLVSDEEESSFLNTSDQQNIRNSLLFQEKIGLSFENNNKKLISGHFKRLREDYKPKVLTTDEYFSRKTVQRPHNKTLVQDFIKPRDGVVISSLHEYPRKHHNTQRNPQSKDYISSCFEKNINKSLKEGNKTYRSPKEMNGDFIKIVRQDEFDKSEFNFARKMLEAKRKANLNQNNKQRSLFIHTHMLMSKLKGQAEDSSAQRTLQEKIKNFLKNKAITKSFLKTGNPTKANGSQSPRRSINPQNTSPPRSSLVDILIKHQTIFGLENQAKHILINQQISNSSREKQLEHQRKLSLFIENPAVEALSATKRSLIESPYIPPQKQTREKEKPLTTQECFALTGKTNKMISERVTQELMDSGRQMEDLLGDIVPGKQKTREKRLEAGLKPKPMEEMRLRNQELSLTTGNSLFTKIG